MKNWKTTLFGFVAAGLLAYGQYSNGQLNPNNIMSDLALLGVGVAAKDHDVTGGTKAQ